MQTVHADQTEISRNKRTTFVVSPLFSLHLAGTEITVPFAQNFHFYFVVFLLHNLSFFPNEIASLEPKGKKPFHLTRKVSEISNRKFWLNKKRSRILMVTTQGWMVSLLFSMNALVAVLLYFIPDFSHVKRNLCQALWELRRAHASASGFPLEDKRNPLV